MAALIFIACSFADEFLRVGCVFVRSRGSFRDCWDYLIETRQERSIRKYLQYLDRLDDGKSAATVECKDRSLSRKNNNQQKIIDTSLGWWWGSNNNMGEVDSFEDDFENIYEYTAIDSVDCCGQTSAMVGAQLIQEAGLVFSCSTLGDVTPGTSFYINGTILKNCERFSINLTLGLTHKDIALHINPRLPQNYVVRNCKINGTWGREEVTSALPFTLKRGHRFSMQILVTEAEYLLSINDCHFAAFAHRIPYGRVTGLQVKGDVQDVEVEQVNVMEYPDKLAKTTDVREDEEEQISSSQTVVIRAVDYLNEDNLIFDDRISYLKLPFYGRILDHFKKGTKLHIFGRVKVLPHSFFVNFQRGDKIWPHPHIAFHLNPRFANVGGKHVICRNSWLDGQWDREERSEIHTDFMPGRSFHLSISCTDGSYLVYLNDKFIAEYKFRVDPNIVDVVYIQGDINLKMVLLETSPDLTTSFVDIENMENEY